MGSRVFRLTPWEPKVKSPYASYRQLRLMAHLALTTHPTDSVADLVDAMKTQCAQWQLSFRHATDITKALEAARWQREHRRRRES